MRDDSRSKCLCLSSLILSQSISCWGLLNSDSLLPAVLSRVCFKLLSASLHGFQTAILQTLVVWVLLPPWLLVQLKQDRPPRGVTVRGFHDLPFAFFPINLSFTFCTSVSFELPTLVLLVLRVLLFLAVLYFFTLVIKKRPSKSSSKLISQRRS